MDLLLIPFTRFVGLLGIHSLEVQKPKKDLTMAMFLAAVFGATPQEVRSSRTSIGVHCSTNTYSLTLRKCLEPAKNRLVKHAQRFHPRLLSSNFTGSGVFGVAAFAFFAMTAV